MSYASRSGRARTSAKNPQAFAVCDRCALWYNRVDLSFQYEWRGTSIQNLWILVCKRCLDIPQEQLRAIQLPADPTPVWQPRVENFADAENDYRGTVPVPPGALLADSGEYLTTDAGVGINVSNSAAVDPITGLPIPVTTLRITDDCENRITQPIGSPDGLVQAAVMPYNGGVQKAFGAPLSVLSVIANGTATVTVTCSRVHGLQQDSQISAEGLTAANGFYSVTVLTATAFSYAAAYNVAAASLLTPTARIVPVLVGLAYGALTIPKIGSQPHQGT